MPLGRNQTLITVAGVMSLKAKGVSFFVRYDLVKLGVKSGGPLYNCAYNFEGEEQEFILVPTNAGPSGFIEDRKLGLWPGIYRHHQQYGDGTLLVLDPETQLLSTWKVRKDGSAALHVQGRDLTSS